EEPCRFQHHLYLLRLPGEVGRVLLGRDPDLATIDDQRLLTRLDRPLEPAVNAVVLQEQGEVLGIRKVIDHENFKVLRPFRHDAEDQSADPAESIDTHSNGHSQLLALPKEKNRRVEIEVDVDVVALRLSAWG